jgi:AGZA family xanthine/uracil permease-like MFS transporter
MAAVAFAMMPHISAFLMVKWGSMMNALREVGATNMPNLSDEAMIGALLQQGAHYNGHLALSQGAIISGLIWGAIVASVIDGHFKNAGGFAVAAGVMSAIGIIHSASLHMPIFSGITIGYLFIGAFLLIYPQLTEVESLGSESDVED